MMSVRRSGLSETTTAGANVPAEMRLYDGLVTEAHPESAAKTSLKT